VNDSNTPGTIAEDGAFVTGIPVDCPNATFTVAGQAVTRPQAVTFLPSVLRVVAATVIAKRAWKGAIPAEATGVGRDGATVKKVRGNDAETDGTRSDRTPWYPRVLTCK
jgi:hypothetical protein